MAKRIASCRAIAVASLAIASSGFSAQPALAQDAARIAIIDSSDSVKPYVKQLAGMGVAVIGRYYGRCPQWKADRSKRIVPEKRMIDNLDEIDAVLKDTRLGLLSVYQFYSQAGKFDSKRASGKVSVLDDRPRNPSARTVEEFNDCVAPDKPNSIEEDARLDGYAAVTQAKEIIKQPAGTTIYFGVDFNLNKDRQENVVKYFRVISKMVNDAGYVVGVYGNGAISDVLRGENPAKEKLVEHVWLTASSGHAGSANTYNTKHWDLLQTKTDTKWLIESAGRLAELDTNMQNPDSAYVGFWKRDGRFTIARDRNVAVHAARRFVCSGSPVVVDGSGQPIARPACTTTLGIVVRTFETDAVNGLFRVDCDEDGQADAWMKIDDLSTRRPLWIADANERKKARCPPG